MVIRLLDTTSLRFSAFEGEDIPEYVILSHTWVQGEEVTFLEMKELVDDSSHPAWGRSGFRKIEGACREARSYDLAYAWVDTCCIDKKDPTELGEAINSMFKWYQQAALCLVYLEDLIDDHSVLGKLGDCRWFTRGWCLQELIAPKTIWFYDRYWKCVAGKKRLCQEISQITDIGPAVLNHELSLDLIPVAQKMSWAAKRRTTRVEDRAYCLLGIFDIHMPLLYGEGVEAFTRLQEEIIKRLDDLSIFAPTSAFLVAQPNTNNMIQPCDLLATSPEAFRNFGRVTFSDRLLDGTVYPFTMTNHGLHFTPQPVQAIMSWDYPLYRLPLRCQFGEPGEHENCLYLFLQKVAPSRFVPVRISNGLAKGGDSAMREEGLYVITKVTPSAKSLITTSAKRFLRLEIPGDVQVGVEPVNEEKNRSRWDHSRRSFFIDSVAITPSVILDLRKLSRMIGTTKHKDSRLRHYPNKHVYVSCILYPNDASGALQVVQLFHTEEWEDMKNDTQGEVVEVPDFFLGGQSESRLRVFTVMIMAKIHKEEYGFTVMLSFKACKEKRDDRVGIYRADINEENDNNRRNNYYKN